MRNSKLQRLAHPQNQSYGVIRFLLHHFGLSGALSSLSPSATTGPPATKRVRLLSYNLDVTPENIIAVLDDNDNMLEAEQTIIIPLLNVGVGHPRGKGMGK